MPNPTPTDLTNYLITLGVTAISQIDEQGIIDATIAELERLTGRNKFQGDAGSTAVRYTLPWPQGQNVILEIADCWTISEIRVGYTGTAGTGTVLTEYEGFEHLPFNHSTRGWPIEAIKFINCPSTNPGAILITGKLGVASTMPQDVFNGILAGAAAQVLKQQAGAEGSVSDQKQGDRSVKFNTADGQSTYQRLKNEFDMMVTRWIKGTY
jgi:hypothetical protein